MSNRNTNYVTVLPDSNGLWKWQRVKGEHKASSTTFFDSFDQACEVANAIAKCNGLRFHKPQLSS